MENDDDDEESVNEDRWRTGYEASPDDGPIIDNLPNPMWGWGGDDD